MQPRSLTLLGLALVLQAAGCGKDQDGAEDDGVARHAVGEVLPDLTLDGEGFRVATSDFRSRVLLIHFFRPDSAECRDAVGRIKSLWFPNRAAGMTVLGVCPDTSAEAIARTVKDWSVPYPVFPDPGRGLAREFAPRTYPWNVVVGRDGTIRLTEKGDWERVEAAVREAIQAKVAGPDHVLVQHVLIAFEGSVPGKTVERSREDAAKLAADVLARAKGGEDFGELVTAYTSDAAPGVYKLANFNVETEDLLDEASRGAVVPSFGDVAFGLAVGEIGMAEYHPLKSPFGWHVIKRLE